MPRPQLEVGTHGAIRVTGRAGRYVALAQFRDLDGISRQVERSGTTKAIAAEWLASIEAAVEAGERSPSTVEQYRRQLEAVVLPRVGSLRVREATVPVLDAFVDSVRTQRGPAVAKLARSVLSGVLGVAVRHGAIRSNPIRDVSRIPTGRRKASRSLTLPECRAWLAQLD